jgi:hypothetical protein
MAVIPPGDFWGLVFVCDAGIWVLGFALFALRWHPPIYVFDGIRELLARFRRRPCAGRHLLFFAAAKKSRQKKAAHTANS